MSRRQIKISKILNDIKKHIKIYKNVKEALKMKKTNTHNRIKRSALIGLTAIIAMLSSTALTSCGCENSANKTATADEVTATAVPATVETLGETDQAVVDAGLTVDEEGNITDQDGNKVEVSDDGKVEVKTADGKTVKVDAQEVKTANDNKVKVDAINEAAASETQNNNSDSGNNKSSGSTQTSKTQSSKTTQSSQSSQTSKSTQTSKSSSSSQTSKSTQNSQTSQSSKPSQTSQSSGGGQTSKPSQSSQTQATTVDPHAGKTWHEAEYKTVNHPAETKQVWVVDVPEHSETVTVYEKKHTSVICWGCGRALALEGLTNAEITEHMTQHHLKGEETGYHSGWVEVPVEKTIAVSEQGHYETQVVKEAWTEKVLVKEAGWY